MRAYRPGLVGGENYDEEHDQEREQKLLVYSQRAEVGLPLFDSPSNANRLSATESILNVVTH